MNNFFTNQATLAVQNSDGNTIQGNTVIGYGQASNVTTSGTAVTWVSGATFTNLAPGMYLCLGGTEYLISTVNSGTSLTLGSSAGTNTNQPAYLGAADEINLDSSSNNSVIGNTVTMGEGYGIVVHQNEDGAESSLNDVVSGNTVRLVGGSCIAINSNASSPTVTSTTVSANAVSDCGQGKTAKGTQNRSAIEISGTGSHSTLISGNTCNDDQGGGATTLFCAIVDPASSSDQVLGRMRQRRNGDRRNRWRTCVQVSLPASAHRPASCSKMAQRYLRST